MTSDNNQKKTYAQAVKSNGSAELPEDTQTTSTSRAVLISEDLDGYKNGELGKDIEVDESEEITTLPVILPDQQIGNEFVQNQLTRQMVTGASQETAIGSKNMDPMSKDVKGYGVEKVIERTAAPALVQPFSSHQSFTMSSNHAYVTIASLEQEETRLDNLIQDLQNQHVHLLEKDPSPVGLAKASDIDKRVDMLTKVIDRTRANLQYKRSEAAQVEVVPQQQTTIITKKQKFKVPLDKVPGFNIEDCDDDSTRAYQMKLANAPKGVQTFATVEDFIDRFEILYNINTTDIDKFWEWGLKQAFEMSLDDAPKLWLKYQLENYRDQYPNWEAMKAKLMKRFMETNIQVAYMFQLLRMRQKTEEHLMNYLQRYIIMMTKAKVQDSLLMDVQWFASLNMYIGPTEAFVNILFEYKTHEEDPTVSALSLNMGNYQPVYFEEGSTRDELSETLERSKTMLTGYYIYYRNHPDTEKIFCSDFLPQFVWKADKRDW
ncbi:hypothetical protein MBANPS3_010586 [Mucor bainieri]